MNRETIAALLDAAPDLFCLDTRDFFGEPDPEQPDPVHWREDDLPPGTNAVTPALPIVAPAGTEPKS